MRFLIAPRRLKLFINQLANSDDELKAIVAEATKEHKSKKLLISQDAQLYIEGMVKDELMKGIKNMKARGQIKITRRCF